ncbi:unnamed protein product [Gordionus sp. m RMFG-2023]
MRYSNAIKFLKDSANTFNISHVTSKMNKNIHPCVDFYEFACGNYIRDTSISNRYRDWTIRSQIGESLLLNIKSILENPHTKYEGMAERQAKIFYDSCVDKANIRETLEGQPLIDLLELFGGWDILNMNNKPSPFIDESSNLKKLKYPDAAFTENWKMGFFDIYSEIDPQNSSMHLFNIKVVDQLTIPNRDTHNVIFIYPEMDKAHLNYMKNIGNLLLSDTNKTSNHFKIQDKERRFNHRDINETLDYPNKEEPTNSQLHIAMNKVLAFEKLFRQLHVNALMHFSQDYAPEDASDSYIAAIKAECFFTIDAIVLATITMSN